MSQGIKTSAGRGNLLAKRIGFLKIRNWLPFLMAVLERLDSENMNANMLTAELFCHLLTMELR